MCGFCGGNINFSEILKGANAQKQRGVDNFGAIFCKNNSKISKDIESKISQNPANSGFYEIASEFLNSKTIDYEFLKTQYSSQNSHSCAFLAHNRLCIIDLNKNSNQPFISPQFPHLCVVFNGEIYNFLEIKEELKSKGFIFKTNSDTEVLCAAWGYFGAENALKRFNGDFAFAIFNSKENAIFLARDRLGNKPLFYRCWCDESGILRLFFASEIKAFLEIFKCEFDKNELAKWLLFCGSENPQKTIYKGIYSFPSASFAKIELKNSNLNYSLNLDSMKNFKELKVRKYWELPKIKKADLERNETRAIKNLSDILQSAVNLRLRADVGCALCVSGGVDSSIIAHFTAQSRADSIKTFKTIKTDSIKNANLPVLKLFGINFAESGAQDESPHIAQLERDLQRLYGDIKIEFIKPNLNSIEQDFPNLCRAQDEIFRSFSQYSQFLLFKEIAARSVRVSIGGQGADELFCGYYHHIGRYIYKNRKEFEKRAKIYGTQALSEYNFGLKCSLPKKIKVQIFAQDNAKNIAKLVDCGILGAEILEILKNNKKILNSNFFKPLLERFSNDFSKGLKKDAFTFSLPMLLRNEDRSAMWHSIENRTPFTDFRVVEFAFGIADELKFKNGYSKWILRKILENLGSKELAWRTDKVGFAAPEANLAKSLKINNFENIFDIRLKIYEILANFAFNKSETC